MQVCVDKYSNDTFNQSVNIIVNLIVMDNEMLDVFFFIHLGKKVTALESSLVTEVEPQQCKDDCVAVSVVRVSLDASSVQ